MKTFIMALAGSGNLSDLTKNHRISKDGTTVKDKRYIANSRTDNFCFLSL